jgi:hypothetical protein
MLERKFLLREIASDLFSPQQAEIDLTALLVGAAREVINC